jgi:hypothetical protein
MPAIAFAPTRGRGHATGGRTKKTTILRAAFVGPWPDERHRVPRLSPPYILSIMALPKPEHETCVEPGMSRAKS